MSSMEIIKACEDLESAVKNFFVWKSRSSNVLESRTFVLEVLSVTRKGLEDALHELNKCHTIWRCRHEDVGDEVLDSEPYSAMWLENEWIEHCNLDDQLDELIYGFSLGLYSATTSTSNSHTTTSEGSFGLNQDI